MISGPKRKIFRVFTITFAAAGVIVGCIFARFVLRDDVSDVALYRSDTLLIEVGDGALGATVGGILIFIVFSLVGIILGLVAQAIANKI